MDIEKILNDKQVKLKEKTETISKLLLDKKIGINELIKFAQISNDPVKATCIEAIEFATKSKPAIAPLACWEFVQNFNRKSAESEMGISKSYWEHRSSLFRQVG